MTIKSYLFHFSATFLIAVQVHSQSADITTIYQRLYDQLISKDPDYLEVERLSATMQEDGSWTDIDYANTTTPPPHLDRVFLLAQAYSKQGNSNYFTNSELRDKIVLSLRYWKNKKPVPSNTNGWYTGIQWPGTYINTCILLKGKIPSGELMEISSFVEDRLERYLTAGQNLLYVANAVVAKGAVEDNDTLIAKSIKAYTSVLKIVTGIDNGIKSDYSYQHHSQLVYNGGYGKDFISSTMNILDLTNGTRYFSNYTPDKLALFGRYVLEGTQHFQFRKTIDFGTIGRYTARKGSLKGLDTNLLDKLIRNDTPRSAQYNHYKDFVNGADFENPAATFFFKSDLLTKNGRNYYMSAKMISVRTIGTEMMNNENRKGYYLPIGSTNFITTGNEYTDIFPIWDWSRIPGVTAEYGTTVPELTGVEQLNDGFKYCCYLRGTNQFAGGASNGVNGICAFNGSYNGITARKAYFVFGNAMVCLGTGINASRSNPIITSVNQCYANGAVTTFTGNKKTTITNSEIVSSSKDQLKWVYHDNIGYIFPNGGSITLKNASQTGNWSDIGTQSETASGKVFSLWIDHTKEPNDASYQYIVAPGLSLKDFQTYYATNGFVVVSNTKSIQAVENSSAGLCGVVFYEAGTIDFGSNFKVTSDKAAIVLISKAGSNYTISVADPLYHAESITLTINRKVEGETVLSGEAKSTIQFKMPSGDVIGSTISNNFILSGIEK